MGQRTQTHCVNGHEFTEANTYLRTRPDGRQHRRCRTCTLAATKLHDVTKRRSSKRGTSRNGLDRDYRSRLRVFLELDYWWRPTTNWGT